MGIINLKVKGGCGNQLSQISFAYKVLNMHKDYTLFVDKKLYRRVIKRNIRFGKLVHKTNTFKFFLDELPVSKIYKDNYKFSYLEKIIFSFHNLILFLLKSFNIFSRIIGFKIRYSSAFYIFLSKIGLYTDDNRSYIDFSKSLIPFITISGYFQDINYHKNQRNKLREFFLKESYKLKEFSLKLKKNYKNVSCLLRLNKDKQIESNVESFLRNSLSKISGLENNCNFIFFSDNQEILKKFCLSISDPIFCDDKDPLLQLYFASLSDVFIISESSFAWWAYFLSDSKSKIVLKPQRWVLDDPIWTPGFFEKDEVINIF